MSEKENEENKEEQQEETEQDDALLRSFGESGLIDFVLHPDGKIKKVKRDV